MTKINVFLGIPCHNGQASICTLRTTMEARGPDLNVRIRTNSYSLLDYNFNLLFATAWTMGADYFLLLHNDIGVTSVSKTESWLGAMVRNMQEGGYAALAGIPPIKSMDGLTSTAIQLTKTNSFTLRRLMVKDLANLPPVITRADVCTLYGLDPATAGCLYINTGCLLMDLKHFKWHEKRWPGFQIRTQLAWSKDGIPKAYTLPEDWRFSQHLSSYGWPYAALNHSVLPVEHLGDLVFNNNPTWGNDLDEEGPRNSSVVAWEAEKQVGTKVLLAEGSM